MTIDALNAAVSSLAGQLSAATGVSYLHASNQITDMTNSFNAPAASVEVVMAKNKTMAHERCVACKKKFVKTDAIVKFSHAAPHVTMICHRRCLETLLAFSVEDEDAAAARLENYRDGLIKSGFRPLHA